jgi:hypothetical protein
MLDIILTGVKQEYTSKEEEQEDREGEEGEQEEKE